MQSTLVENVLMYESLINMSHIIRMNKSKSIIQKGPWGSCIKLKDQVHTNRIVSFKQDKIKIAVNAYIKLPQNTVSKLNTTGSALD